MTVIFHDVRKENAARIENVVLMEDVLVSVGNYLHNAWLLHFDDGTQLSYLQKYYILCRVEA